MKRVHLLVLGAIAALLVGGGSNALAGKGNSTTCSGPLTSGSYGSVTVAGTCAVGFNANIVINGDLTLSDGAAFAGIIPSTVHVTGNVKVGKGAILGLGYATPNDVVDGNVDANQPLSVYLGGVTIHGNVTSNGGGSSTKFYNFPIKDNTIDGNLTLHGWQGGWIGALRNHVGGKLDISNVGSVVHAADGDACDASGTFPNGCVAAPGADPDSTEVTDNVVAGNLICHGNSPAAQAGDSGGGPNIVSGNKIGECAGL